MPHAHTSPDARISPVFRYRHAREAIDWLERAFGFRRTEVHEGPDGTIVHAELRLGAGGVAISSAGPEVADNPWTHVRTGLYVCTSTPDPFYERAMHARAEIVQPIRDLPYGSREFSVRDPEGHLWSFGTYGVGSPDGDPDVFVGLQYRDGPAALTWLETALGCRRTVEIAGADGTVNHAELRLGRATVMVNSVSPSASGTADRQYTCVTIDDPDGQCAQARSAGAAILREPHDTPYGARAYSVRDLEGFLWFFSTYAPAGN